MIETMVFLDRVVFLKWNFTGGFHTIRVCNDLRSSLRRSLLRGISDYIIWPVLRCGSFSQMESGA